MSKMKLEFSPLSVLDPNRRKRPKREIITDDFAAVDVDALWLSLRLSFS